MRDTFFGTADASIRDLGKEEKSEFMSSSLKVDIISFKKSVNNLLLLDMSSVLKISEDRSEQFHINSSSIY